MLIQWNKHKGQTTLEYAVLIVVVAAALFTIQTYMKRGLQGKMKSSADDIGNQFDPGATATVTKTVRKSKAQDVFDADAGATGGGSKTTLLADEVTNRESQTIVTGETVWGANPQPIVNGTDSDFKVNDLFNQVSDPALLQ